MSVWIGVAFLVIGGFTNLTIEDTDENNQSVLETVSRLLGIIGIVLIVFSWLGIV